MKTAKELKRIADEKNEISKEVISNVSDKCFDRIVELFEKKLFSSAIEGNYSASMDVEPYINLSEIPYNKRDEIHKRICDKICKYYKTLGFTVKFYDDLQGRLFLQVWWY